jgi:hypothetical protein
MKELLTSEEFPPVQDALKKYEEWPPEIEAARTELQKQSEKMVEATKNALLDACELADPAEVTAVLEKYTSFGDTVKNERQSLERRYDNIMELANTELQTLADRENVTETEIKELLTKYESYPVSQIRKARDALKARQVVVMTNIQDRMKRLASRADITLTELDEALAEYEGREEEVGEALKVVQERRKTLADEIGNKLKEGAQLEDPAKISKLIEEAAAFGDTVENEVKALADQRDKLLTSASEDMKKLLTSEDFNEISTSLKKYEKWPDGVQEARAELQKKREEIVDGAKEKLFELCAGNDPNAMKTELVPYEIYGDAVSEQVRAVESRRKQLFVKANQEMMELSKKEGATLEEMQTMATMYEDYPDDEVGSALIALKRALGRTSSSMGAELTRLIVNRVTDLAVIDSTLQKYTDADQADAPAAGAAKDGAADSEPKQNLLQNEIDDVKKYRESLEEDMKNRLLEAAKLEHPTEVREVIALAEPFSEKGPFGGGNGLEAEIKSLVTHEEQLFTTAKDEIKKATGLDDFAQLHETLERYASYPDEPIQAEKSELQKKHEDMVTEAKSKLLELCDSDDAVAIVQEVEKYSVFGDVVDTQRTAANARIDVIIQGALREINSFQSKPDVTLQEIQAMVEKYKDFPPQVKSGLETLRGMKRNAMSGAKDRLKVLLAGTDIKAIDAWLAEMQKPGDEGADASTASAVAAGDKDGAEKAASVADQMKDEIEEMTTYRKKLEDDIKTRLKELSTSEDPIPMVAALEEAEVYGEAVDAEKKAVETQKEKLITDAKESINKLVSAGPAPAAGASEGGSASTGDDGLNFADVESSLEKYSAWPSELQESVQELRKFRDDTVEAAKNNLLALMDSTDPKHIEDEITKYDAYGNAVKIGVDAANKRLQTLFKDAAKEIDALVKPGALWIADCGMLCAR